MTGHDELENLFFFHQSLRQTSLFTVSGDKLDLLLKKKVSRMGQLWQESPSIYGQCGQSYHRRQCAPTTTSVDTDLSWHWALPCTSPQYCLLVSPPLILSLNPSLAGLFSSRVAQGSPPRVAAEQVLLPSPTPLALPTLAPSLLWAST